MELPQELEDLIKEFAKPLTRPNYKYVFPPHRQAIYSHLDWYWGSDFIESYDYGFEFFNLELPDKYTGDCIRRGTIDYISPTHRDALENHPRWKTISENLLIQSFGNITFEY